MKGSKGDSGNGGCGWGWTGCWVHREEHCLRGPPRRRHSVSCALAPEAPQLRTLPSIGALLAQSPRAVLSLPSIPERPQCHDQTSTIKEKRRAAGPRCPLACLLAVCVVSILSC